MRASYFSQHGKLDQIQYGDLPNPILQANEVMVALKFAALNHLDLFVTEGWSGLQLKMPHILGSDGSGVVHQIGANVSTVKVGDRVTINPSISCGKCSACLAGEHNFCESFSILGEHRWGTYAEYVVIPETNVLSIPADVSYEIAAAAPLTFLTAWRMLITLAQVHEGDYVLIQGGGGGVATAAIQIAKFFGATVITTTTSPQKVAKVKDVGADYVINLQDTPEYAKIIYREMTAKHGIDIAVDSVGTKTFLTSMKLLRPGGTLVTCGATTGGITDMDIRLIFWKQLKILGSTMSNQREFRTVMDLVMKHKLTPVIDKIFPLDQVREAEQYLETGNQFGKVLIRI